MLPKQSGAPLEHSVFVSLNVALDDTRWTATGREHLIQRCDFDRHVVIRSSALFDSAGFETGFG